MELIRQQTGRKGVEVETGEHWGPESHGVGISTLESPEGRVGGREDPQVSSGTFPEGEPPLQQDSGHTQPELGAGGPESERRA